MNLNLWGDNGDQTENSIRREVQKTGLKFLSEDEVVEAINQVAGDKGVAVIQLYSVRDFGGKISHDYGQHECKQIIGFKTKSLIKREKAEKAMAEKERQNRERTDEINRLVFQVRREFAEEERRLIALENKNMKELGQRFNENVNKEALRRYNELHGENNER